MQWRGGRRDGHADDRSHPGVHPRVLSVRAVRRHVRADARRRQRGDDRGEQAHAPLRSRPTALSAVSASWLLAKDVRDAGLKISRRGSRISGLPNGTAHNDVISAVLECGFDVDDALLIVALFADVLDRSDARHDDENLVAGLRAQVRHLEARGDETVAPAASTRRARSSTICLTSTSGKPRPRRSPTSRLVSTVTARIFTSVCSPRPFTAARIMLSCAWTVTNEAPRTARFRTDASTVSGMSNSLTSANAFLPLLTSQSNSSQNPSAKIRLRPSL